MEGRFGTFRKFCFRHNPNCLTQNIWKKNVFHSFHFTLSNSPIKQPTTWYIPVSLVSQVSQVSQVSVVNVLCVMLRCVCCALLAGALHVWNWNFINEISLIKLQWNFIPFFTTNEISLSTFINYWHCPNRENINT